MQRDLQTMEEVRSRWDVVRFELKRAEDLEDTVAAFFEGAGNVGSERFAAFAATLPSVNFQAISFAAYVPATLRAEFENSAQAQHSAMWPIWELDAEGWPTAASARDAYLPVTCMYPATGNLAALGFDLLSEPRRRGAALLAMRTGKTVRTDPIRLVQDREHWAFLVFKPVYARHTRATSGDSGERVPVGLVSAVYKFDSLLEAAVEQRTTSDQQIALFDTSAPSLPVAVHHSRAATRDRPDLQRSMAEVAAMPGARLARANAMQNELEAVFLVDDASSAWWNHSNAAILATLVLGLLLTAAGVRNHVLAYRLATRLSRSTEEARVRKEEAERANTAKSRVLAYASHDLRQPLHALELFVARLKEQPLEYATAKIVGHVDDAARALAALLDGLLDLPRLESGAIRPVFRAVPVAALWDRLQSEFAATAAANGLELRFRPSPLWLMTDPELLHRILLNLLGNAIRYTKRGGVFVACRRAGDRARIQVWDTGKGIASEYHEDVFKEFVRLGNHDGGPITGRGLGLSIVQRTAALLDHALSMRSVPGRGSCFGLEVPIAEPVAATDPAAEAPGFTDGDSFTGMTVLVVEDDPLARRALVDLLRSWHCGVIESSSAGEALQKLADGCRPDLIASDLRLPNGQSGIELVARVRTILGHEVAAFIVSGDTSARTMEAARAARLVLLHKPVKAPRLRRAMHILTESRRASAR